MEGIPCLREVGVNMATVRAISIALDDIIHNTLRYAAPRCATLRYSRLFHSILSLRSILFYSINFKLTVGWMDVKTDEDCGVPYSK